MAYIQDDDKQLGDKPEQLAGTQATQGPLVGGSSNDVGSGVSTAGVGAGGQGGWTNIQAYLNANAGNTTTANALNNQVGGAFDQEESKLNDQSGQAKQQADNEKLQGYSNEQVDEFIRQGSGLDDGIANQAKTSMQSYLNKQYQGPQQFQYGLGNESMSYGEQLGNDQGFKGLLNNVYNRAAGGQISTGQKALQDQLDTNNQAVQDARSSLGARYSALNNMAQSRNQEVADAITGAKSSYGQQGQTRDYLGSRAQTAKSRYDEILNATNGTGWSDKYGDMVSPVAREYNAIQNFLGSGSSLAIPERPEAGKIADDQKDYEPIPGKG